MRYLRNTSTDVYFNMAFDEYALEQLPLDEPLFFLWQNRPAVIIGINQNAYAEVDIDYLHQHDIALARRITGGGAVYHDLGNLNYTIVGRSSDIERDYPQYTRHMLHALQALGIQAELSGRNDILVEGRKVSGFAKRVCKNRLMVHGTLMYNVDVDVLTKVLNPSNTKLQSKGIASVRSRVANLCDYLPEIPNIQTFSNRLEEILSCNNTDTEYQLSDTDLANIQLLTDKKFATWEWNYGRSPKATLTHSSRLACGTVEIHLTLTENRISSCRFGGDFLGNLPATDLESALIEVIYDTENIEKRLSSFTISDYFDGVTVEELVKLILPKIST